MRYATYPQEDYPERQIQRQVSVEIFHYQIGDKDILLGKELLMAIR